jgi:hypothetical protein
MDDSTPVLIEVAALPRMTVPQLLARYCEVFGEATASRNKGWLVKKIAWRLQADAEGGLTDRIRQRAAELAEGAQLRVIAPRAKSTAPAVRMNPSALPPMAPVDRRTHDPRLPMVGTVVVRIYKGREVQVTVLADGFLHDGVTYDSLSAVANAVTGTHCNGFAFFRLNRRAA